MPDNNHILQHIQAAYEKVVPQAEKTLTLEDELVDLGVGSIAALEMAAILEEQFEVNFPDDRFAQLITVRDFVALVDERMTDKRKGTQGS